MHLSIPAKSLATLLTFLVLPGAAAGARAAGPTLPGNGGSPVAAGSGFADLAASVPTPPVSTVPVPTVAPVTAVPVPPPPVTAAPPPVTAAPPPVTAAPPPVSPAPPPVSPAPPPVSPAPPPASPMPAPVPTAPAPAPPAATTAAPVLTTTAPTSPAPATPTDPGAAEANTTTQTISQVEVAPCLSHCDGGVQIQSATQQNTTVQAPAEPPPSGPPDGGAALDTGNPPTGAAWSSPEGSSPTPAPSSPAPAPAHPPQPAGVSQVQVGCVQHCYGTTTLDTSGLTLQQIEQMLGELQAPTLAVPTPAPATQQNVTQQASTQSQSGQGAPAAQVQAASQTNTTVQVAGGAPQRTAGTAAGSVVVNQTAQGIWQLQVGCIFYCTGTGQAQRAEQSNTTVQAVGGAPVTVGGAVPAAANTGTGLITQVQVGCLVWCYDSVESQTAAASETEVVLTSGGPPASSSSSARSPSRRLQDRRSSHPRPTERRASHSPVTPAPHRVWIGIGARTTPPDFRVQLVAERRELRKARRAERPGNRVVAPRRAHPSSGVQYRPARRAAVRPRSALPVFVVGAVLLIALSIPLWHRNRKP